MRRERGWWVLQCHVVTTPTNHKAQARCQHVSPAAVSSPASHHAQQVQLRKPHNHAACFMLPTMPQSPRHNMFHAQRAAPCQNTPMPATHCPSNHNPPIKPNQPQYHHAPTGYYVCHQQNVMPEYRREKAWGRTIRHKHI